ncbi:MAG: DNA-binding response regulator [Ignavibacteriae bacterium HGW-Ignavibacteriae-3]|nr:MAG: DNA-binding response regulator [Ignavibacteriae bacterium HGW-Ignavibacteriae-3]
MNILIAEDEKAIANSLKKNFLAEGYTAKLVSDGAAVISSLENENFDIILLDWRMPKMTGLQVCKAIRESGNNTPIILLTALSDVSNKIDALKAGADDYITKPFNIEEVFARIEAVIRRTASAEPVLHCGSFSLNLFTHCVESGESSLKLTEKEFALLHFLVSNKGVVINRETLFEKVWGINYTPGTNFVDVTIKNLRKRLESITPGKCIKTVYGEGYVFLGD